MRDRRIRPLILAASCMLMAFRTGAANNFEPQPGLPTEAIWRVQEFDFHFRAARGHYHSCSSLHTKINGILEAVGAGSVVVKIACSRDGLVDNTFARVATAMPIQATPENVQAATTFDSEQQLVARLRQLELPTQESLQRFPAEWRTVSIASARGLRLGPEDCDLLQDLHEQIFPHLPAVRVVRQRFSCGDSYLRPARPILVVEALMRRQA